MNYNEKSHDQTTNLWQPNIHESWNTSKSFEHIPCMIFWIKWQGCSRGNNPTAGTEFLLAKRAASFVPWAKGKAKGGMAVCFALVDGQSNGDTITGPVVGLRRIFGGTSGKGGVQSGGCGGREGSAFNSPALLLVENYFSCTRFIYCNLKCSSK